MQMIWSLQPKINTLLKSRTVQRGTKGKKYKYQYRKDKNYRKTQKKNKQEMELYNKQKNSNTWDQ